jgi:hypothetical protein
VGGDPLDRGEDGAASIYGYTYKVWDAGSGTFLGWYPFDPYNPAVAKKFAYAYLIPSVVERELADGQAVTAVNSELRLWAVPHASRSADINFILPEAEAVRIELYDISGRSVRVWEEKQYPVGKHGVHWDGILQNGGKAGAGVYTMRFTSGDRSLTRKILLY